VPSIYRIFWSVVSGYFYVNVFSGGAMAFFKRWDMAVSVEDVTMASDDTPDVRTWACRSCNVFYLMSRLGHC